MKNLRIYRLAMRELLSTRDFEESRLYENPDNEITMCRIDILDKEIKELCQLVVEESSAIQ